MPHLPDPVDPTKLTDRELLLILHERVGSIGSELHELKDGYAQRIASIESDVRHLQEVKADLSVVKEEALKQNVVNDLRTAQINKITNRLAFAAGALAVLQVGLTLLAKFGWPH